MRWVFSAFSAANTILKASLKLLPSCCGFWCLFCHLLAQSSSRHSALCYFTEKKKKSLQTGTSSHCSFKRACSLWTSSVAADTWLADIRQTLFPPTVGCLKTEWHRKGQKHYYIKYRMIRARGVEEASTASSSFIAQVIITTAGELSRRGR